MAGIKEEKKIYLVGIYCRLSKDDGTDNESASIATQKSILTDYVKKQGWHIAKTYVDDGYSGTNFQRPSFQNMIKDIESGLINCVITKDLSRLGRNYLDCGLYLEVFFPEHNVRYIAVNDGVDTLNKSAMDITPFRNILNEMYAADISVKIKSAYRARFQQGKFMGTTAPYGYIKDPADHNHLLIDDKVAHVVKEIFDLALKGNGVAKICRHLNKQHILRPAAYAAERGETGFERHFEGNEDKRYIWSGNSVRSILRSPIYAGNLVGYKRIAANMKSKKRPSKLPEEWEVIPNTHEGIVTQEEFDIVQQLITSRRLPQNKGGFVNIFAGVIKCVDCGCALRAMNVHRRKRPEIIDCVQYSCNNYARNGRSECSAHNIEARDLFNAVLADINCFADMAVNDEKAVRAIEKRLTETDQSRAKALEKERKKLNKRLAELDRLFSSLYEDKVMERITERNFEMMSGKYQKEQLEIEARLKEVTETLNESYEKSRGIRDFLALIRNYQGLHDCERPWTMWRKVAIWTQAIYNAFNDNICEYDDEVLRSKEKEIIDRIAVVNVKKSNGGSESEYEDLKKYALEDRLEIKRELEIIQPDIIVCGNNLSLLKLVLGEELQNDDTWDNMLALWKDTLVLDYYHPAVHYPNRVNYYALMAICDVARKKYGTPVWSEQNEKY
jgi:site-specific DNA recombinase